MKHFDIKDFVTNSYYKMNPGYFAEVISILNSSHSGFYRRLLNSNNRHLTDWISVLMPELNSAEYNASTKLNWLLSDRHQFPVCTNPRCCHYQTSDGFKHKNIRILSEYPRFCDRTCQNSHPEKLRAAEQTCQSRYGTSTTLSVKEFRDKGIKTLYENHGVINPGQSEKNHQIQLEKSYREFLLTNRYDQPLFSLNEYLARADDHQLLRFQCLKCGSMFEAMHDNGHHRRCPICYSSRQTSYKEKELVEWIQTIYSGSIIENDKHLISPKELDLVLPDLRLAIEFNGLYWHQTDYKPDLYHQLKSDLCEQKGFKLIHVFEDRWNVNSSLIRQQLARICNPASLDRCTDYQLSTLNLEQAKAFISTYSFDAVEDTDSFIGVIYRNQIVGVLSYAIDSASVCHIHSYCSSPQLYIVDGLKTMLQRLQEMYNIQQYEHIVDRRFPVYDEFIENEFIVSCILPPKTWYWSDPAVLLSEYHSNGKLQYSIQDAGYFLLTK